ncbi:enoyl-CoA hydratase/isomerase family protein [Salirhabdus sp. Marseille-P4669]|uniref:enoyl-CoA hydratase/isomerase family protein n=1 Tax=Salirhabdus sp. Marseille-P4669 TaxID=2042310 RepID=UPI000C7C9465|nr:enoyl-CoA hydratase/isomerase family protein [Salirhabdus sp. Marseille-P4669]
MFESLIYEHNQEEKYITITLNRPEKRNAVSISLAKELDKALEMARSITNLKFLVLTGSGEKAFCSGGDLNDFHGDMSEDEVLELLQPINQVLVKLFTFPVPTISILNGHSRGGGCELATACDFRFAREGTTHGFIQGKLGILPGWGGGAMLYKRIAPTYAYYWLTSSDVYSVDELNTWGWIQQVYHAGDNLMNDLVKPFLQKNIKQMQHFKQQYLSQPLLNNLQEQMEQELKTCAELWVSDEHKKAVDSFLRKSK